MNSLSVYDQLDQAIDRLMLQPGTFADGKERNLVADVESSDGSQSDSELTELLAIAAELRDLPREEFKSRLGVELEWQAAGRELSITDGASRARASVENAVVFPTLLGQTYGATQRAPHFADSVALHAAVGLLLAALLFAGGKPPLALPKRIDSIPLASSYACCAPQSGGNSGGANDKLRASHGDVLPSSQLPLTRPNVLPPQAASLPVPATIIAPDLPHTQQAGDPFSDLFPLSNGHGLRGGVGNGNSGMVGDGPGNSYGPGGDGNSYVRGNGVTAPQVLYSPEPEFSEEARRVKQQGVVTLWAVIGTDGRARNIRVQRSLGMGLDEKAVESLRTWRFRPGMRDGHPVAVEISVEVNFHLY